MASRKPSSRPPIAPTTASARLLTLYQAAGSIALSPTLQRHVTLDALKLLETTATTTNDSYIRGQLTIIDTQLTKLLTNIGDGQAIQDLKDAVNEATTYVTLKHLDASTTAIPRSKTKGQATPDFTVTLPDGALYLEYKSLNMVGGTAKQQTLLTNSLAANIALPRQLRAGQKTATATTVIQPYHTPGAPYDYTSTRMVMVPVRVFTCDSCHHLQFIAAVGVETP